MFLKIIYVRCGYQSSREGRTEVNEPNGHIDKDFFNFESSTKSWYGPDANGVGLDEDDGIFVAFTDGDYIVSLTVALQSSDPTN